MLDADGGNGNHKYSWSEIVLAVSMLHQSCPKFFEPDYVGSRPDTKTPPREILVPIVKALGLKKVGPFRTYLLNIFKEPTKFKYPLQWHKAYELVSGKKWKPVVATPKPVVKQVVKKVPLGRVSVFHITHAVDAIRHILQVLTPEEAEKTIDMARKNWP